MPGLLASDRPGKMPRLRCRFAAKGAEEGLRGAVAFGSLEKKRQASAASTVQPRPGATQKRHLGPQRHTLALKVA